MVATGGGGRYYAGCNIAHCSGSGGFIVSGYTGCNTIKVTSTATAIEHSNTPNHYSGYIFTNSTMIAGNISMPAPGGAMKQDILATIMLVLHLFMTF